MSKEIEEVAFVKCNSYNQKEVDKAVFKSLNLINFEFKKGMKVLIKPNVVGSFPRKQIATTTHPSLIEAVCKILKKNKCEIFIGDSPFTYSENSFKSAGIDKIAKKYGKLIIFEQDKIINIKNNNAKILKNFKTAQILKDVDLIINMPKLKTHVLTKLTGAIKNLYGVIPGGMKQQIHVKAKDEKDFSKILVDIYQIIKPQLNIMDGIIGMEGEGPTSGDLIKVGIILTSKNSISLDIASANLIGLNPKEVYFLDECIKRKLYPNFEFKQIPENKKFPKFNFKIPSSNKSISTSKQLKILFKEKPIVVNEKLCTKCGLCARKCPTNSIDLCPYPKINPKTCIRCFCCIEVCPQNALMLQN